MQEATNVTDLAWPKHCVLALLQAFLDRHLAAKKRLLGTCGVGVGAAVAGLWDWAWGSAKEKQIIGSRSITVEVAAEESCRVLWTELVVGSPPLESF